MSSCFCKESMGMKKHPPAFTEDQIMSVNHFAPVNCSRWTLSEGVNMKKSIVVVRDVDAGQEL